MPSRPTIVGPSLRSELESFLPADLGVARRIDEVAPAVVATDEERAIEAEVKRALAAPVGA